MRGREVYLGRGRGFFFGEDGEGKYLGVVLDGILDDGGDGEGAFCVCHCLRGFFF